MSGRAREVYPLSSACSARYLFLFPPLTDLVALAGKPVEQGVQRWVHPARRRVF